MHNRPPLSSTGSTKHHCVAWFFSRAHLALILGLALAFGGATSLHAQTAATGSVNGRIFNPATNEYVRNAEVRVAGTGIETVSEDAGYYRLANVPAGEITLVISYPGYDSITQKINVPAGAAATRDFEITAMGATEKKGDAVVSLDTYVVSAEREGNAKAIADQKASMNIKTVISADSFGQIAEGNIGEFLKFLPGITLDYVETDTRAARMGGLEARYGAVTLDGGSVANTSTGSFGGESRQFEFEAMSINNIESIEVYKTLSADMQADAPAGTVNLTTKSALDRRGRRLNYVVGMIGNQYEHSLTPNARHDDTEHAKTRPTFGFDFSDNLFKGRLGVSINGGSTTVFKEQFRNALTYDYTSAQAVAASSPLITAINFKDGPKMTDKYSGGLKLDFQASPRLRISFASSYIWFSDSIANRNLNFRVSSAQEGAGSNMTRVIANPVAGNGTRIEQSGGTSAKQTNTSNASIRFVYKGNNFTFDGQSSYSRARQQNGSDDIHMVNTANTQLTRISYTAERPSIDSSAWTFTQTGGPDWYDWNNYGRNFDASNGNISSSRSRSKAQQFVQQMNFKYIMPWQIPTFFKTGVYDQLSVRDKEQRTAYTGTWVGPTGNQLTSSMPESIAEFRISQPWGGNIWSLPVPDKTKLFALTQSNPAYFTTTEAQAAANLESVLGSNQDLEEQIRAGYILGNTRVGKWQLQAGVRYETAETTSKVIQRLPDAENPFAVTNASGVKVAPNPLTVNFIRARYSLPRSTTSGDYSNVFPSASATYTFNDHLVAKFGYHKAIGRPDLDSLGGVWEIDEINQEISVPSANLKPEHSDKVSALLEYYFEPAGVASVHVFHSNLDGAIIRTPYVTADQFGYGDDPVYKDYLFRGWLNVPGITRLSGIELSYRQQLTFFQNRFLRGLTVFGSYAQYSRTPVPPNFIPRSASGGVTVRYRKFGGKIAGTWTDKSYTQGNTVAANAAFFAGDREILDQRYIFDIDASYELSRRFKLFISVRNAFNSGKTWFFEKDGRTRQFEKYGGQWTIGLSGDL
jgi:iron complex outermembrane recepter protein